MDAITEFVNNNVIPHWPFIGVMVVFMIVMQVVKINIFTKTAHQKHKPVWFWWWGRKTLALQPIVVGMILGILWRNPEAGVDTLAECMGYFALAGSCSVWTYEILKGVAQKRGINLELPGVDDAKQ